MRYISSVHRAAPWACLLLFLAPWAAAATSVDDQDLSASIRQLDTGDWSARMRTVHELEYLQDAAIPALSVAAVDGDWQVRMAAVHALAFLPKATPIMQAVLKHEPCPVVRLITLHNLGSQAADGAEEQAMSWIFSASNTDVNNCVDQAAPGRAPWASKVIARATTPKAEAAPAPAPRPRERPEPEAAPESDDANLTPDIPKRAPPAAPPPAPKAPAESPTRSARYAELDTLLADSSGPKESLRGVPPLPERPSSPPDAPRAAQAPARPETNAGLAAPRASGTPETLPRPVVTLPQPEQPVEAPAKFEDAGGEAKVPHDSLPDLLAALKSPDAKTRSRAADQLGSAGAAAGAAVPALVAALRDKSPRVRASASLALGDIGSSDSGVVPLLVKALKDKNVDVRYAAALALSRIKTPEARAAFERHIGEDARRAIERRQQ